MLQKEAGVLIVNKQLLNEVFVISGIIKFEVSVINRSRINFGIPVSRASRGNANWFKNLEVR